MCEDRASARTLDDSPSGSLPCWGPALWFPPLVGTCPLVPSPRWGGSGRGEHRPAFAVTLSTENLERFLSSSALRPPTPTLPHRGGGSRRPGAIHDMVSGPCPDAFSSSWDQEPTTGRTVRGTISRRRIAAGAPVKAVCYRYGLPIRPFGDGGGHRFIPFGDGGGRVGRLGTTTVPHSFQRAKVVRVETRAVLRTMAAGSRTAFKSV